MRCVPNWARIQKLESCTAGSESRFVGKGVAGSTLFRLPSALSVPVHRLSSEPMEIFPVTVFLPKSAVKRNG